MIKTNEITDRDNKKLGYQIGVRKTFDVSTEKIWDFLLSEKGIGIWLGKISMDDFEIQKVFISMEGIEGKLTVFKPNCHLRLKWKPKHWERLSTIELRVTASKGRASVLFHQTGFYEIEKKEEIRLYWKKIFEKIKNELLNQK